MLVNAPDISQFGFKHSTGIIVFLIVISVLLFTPIFKYSFSVDSIETSKTVFFLWAMIAIGTIFIIRAIWSDLFTIIRITRIDFAILAYFLFFLINRYIVHRDQGVHQNLIEFPALITFYIVLRHLSNQKIIIAFLAVAISGIIEAIIGGFQLIGWAKSNHGFFTLTGSFLNPGPYGGFLAIAISISIGFYLFQKDLIVQNPDSNIKFPKFIQTIWTSLITHIPAFSILATILILPATRSRAAFVALSVTMCVFSIWFTFTRFAIYKKYILNLDNNVKIRIATLIFIIICVAVNVMHNSEKESVNGRILIWNATSRIIIANPIFGVGYDALQSNYMNAQANYLSDKLDSMEAMLAGNTIYVFNDSLHFLAENGIIGVLIAFALAYFCITLTVNQSSIALKAISIGIIICICTFGQFSYPLQLLPFKIIFVLALATLGKLDKEVFHYTFKANKPIFKRIILMRTLIVSFGVASTVVISLKILHYQSALVKWSIALSYYNEGNYDSSLKIFADAYSTLSSNGNFLLNYGKVLQMAGKPYEASIILSRSRAYLSTSMTEITLGQAYKDLGQFDKAHIAFAKAIAMLPSHYYPRYLMVKFLKDTKQRKKAYIEAKKLLRRPVKVPSTAVKEMRLDLELIVKNEESLSSN